MPGGRKKVSLKSMDGLAFELLHGAWLCHRLLEEAVLSATPAFRKRYPELDRQIEVAQENLFELYQKAGQAWSAEGEAAAKDRP